MDFLRYVPRTNKRNFDPLIVQIPISDHSDADPAWGADRQQRHGRA